MTLWSEEYMDKVFREKLNAYEVEPSPYLFDEIEASVRTGIRMKKRAVFLRSAAVVLLLVSFGIGYFTADFDQPQEAYIVVKDWGFSMDSYWYGSENEKELPFEPFVYKDIKRKKASKHAKQNQTAENEMMPIRYFGGNNGKDEKLAHLKSNAAFNLQQYSDEKTLDKRHTPLFTALSQHKDFSPQVVVEEKQSVSPDWKLGSSFSRYFALQTTKFQAQEAGQASFSKDGIDYPMSTVSGGIDFAVEPVNRLMVYTGVYFARKNGVVDDVTLKFSGTSSSGAVNNDTKISSTILPEIHIDLDKQTVDNLISLKKRSENLPSYGRIGNSSYYEFGLNLDQQYDYVEIPAGIAFKFIDKKLKVSAIAGLSASILVNQQAQLYDEDKIYWEDEVDGLTKHLYHTRLGLSLDFPVYKSLSFYLQPTYRRDLNSIYKDIEQPSNPDRIAVFGGFNVDL